MFMMSMMFMFTSSVWCFYREGKIGGGGEVSTHDATDESRLVEIAKVTTKVPHVVFFLPRPQCGGRVIKADQKTGWMNVFIMNRKSSPTSGGNDVGRQKKL